jgi:hypothetical protein
LGKKRGPDNFLATVAVNKRGVVLVTWYDRSDNPDLGWYVRARASLDGGETWLPSIRVSEKPNTFPPRKVFTQTWVEEHRHVVTIFQPSQFFAGDYAGLAADARGTFHALWVDNRTGLPQVWTAAIEVAGTAIQNGSSELAQFTDVSDDLELEVVSSDYDRASNTVTIGIRLKNLSAKIIHGPVKLHLMNVNSTTGSPSVVNADNKMADAGAEWDFSSSLTNNVLSKVHHLQLGNLSSGLKTLATCRMTKQMHG